MNNNNVFDLQATLRRKAATGKKGVYDLTKLTSEELKQAKILTWSFDFSSYYDNNNQNNN